MIAKLGIYEKALAEKVEWVSSPDIGQRVLARTHEDAEKHLKEALNGEGFNFRNCSACQRFMKN